jgi:hypothetical protein
MPLLLIQMNETPQRASTTKRFVIDNLRRYAHERCQTPQGKARSGPPSKGATAPLYAVHTIGNSTSNDGSA